ncbi:type IV pilus biogenesis/stability protein PilW [Pseudoalteromonas denitrificans]|uniref:Type IV pilus assembly protein PilF n=1 Tax=Pseudoalteromonas denitrificans DSM 6059 TaxID=1123010 RepID=A0A1I1L472_9GAMM|nr:type IV pilus biogenesis/stability protein PilW [Pseudoalteromonas denitrificans]SFC67856.1 type IV pilus assembly protein PilF [Pseudoalteromonas denitrificans DSM 6059]
MRHLLFYSLILLSVSGCVTQNVYEGSKKSVVNKKVDNSQAARTRISLALKYLSMGDSSQAKFNLEKAYQFSPKLPEVHYTTAYYYQSVGEPGKAKKSYKTALALAPNDANTLNNYGVFLCDIGEYDNAIDNFLRAIEIPSYLRVAESYENLALCAIESDDFDNVEGYLKSSVKHSPMRGSSLINLAAFYYAKSDLHKAQGILKRYESAGRISSRSLLLSYLIESSMGHIETASNLAKTIEQTYTTSSEARILRQNKTASSEFERLKDQYRKSELRKLQKDILSRKEKPKIKIIKKKKAPKVPKVAQVINKNTELVIQKPKVDVLKSEKLNVEETSKTEKSVDSENEATQVINKIQEPIVEVLKAEESTVEEILMTETDVPKVSLNKVAPVINKKTELVIQEPKVEASKTEKTSVSEGVIESKSLMIEQAYSSVKRDVTQIETPFHIVKNGENLFNLSVKYNVKLKTLLAWNNLTENDQVFRGTKIFLNNPNVYHQVTGGDTLFSISLKYNILMKKLLEWNALKENTNLTPNHKILLVDPKTYIL